MKFVSTSTRTTRRPTSSTPVGPIYTRPGTLPFVTTASYTAQAIALAADAGVELIDGQHLPPLSHTGRVVRTYPDPSVPVVLPEYSNSHAHLTFLKQLLPQTPVIQRAQLNDGEQREISSYLERLLALTPDQLRKACILDYVGIVGERDRPGIRLLESHGGPIRDWIVLLPTKPQIRRSHQLPADGTVTSEDIDQFLHFANANGYEAGGYSTTGLFTAEVLLRGGLSKIDGWNLAHGFWYGFHERYNQDCIALAQLSGWPKRLEEGTERSWIARKLFPVRF